MTYPLPREFRMADGGFGRMVLPFVFMLAFFFVVMLLLGSIFAGTLGGIGIATVATGAMVGVLYSKFKRMKEGTVVRFSEHGVELSDKLGFHVTLAWRDITKIGQVNTQMANPAAIESGDVSVSVKAMQSQGIIGWGHRTIPPRAPAWMRENLANQPTNPADGRPLVAIPLGGIDPNWLRGPMAQWIRLYRPDLLGGAQPQPYPTPASAHPAPQAYPSQPQTYPNSAPQAYPNPAPQGFPNPAPQGYPNPALQGYPNSAPQGYANPAPQAFPNPVPQGYPNYPPQGR